jgi:aerobic-type carbon monoxide dehydrogenase small subunit (CoxS/CutS family)
MKTMKRAKGQSPLITLSINGAEHMAVIKPTTTLLQVLRDQLGLTGAKCGCNQGVCGACTVLLDGKPARACLSLAANCTGRKIVTIEGIGSVAQLSRVQQAFIDAGAVQCGFCTPGMVLSSESLLAENPKPSVAEIRTALSGNLCRCTGYKRIIEAVRLASKGEAQP